MKWSFPPLQPGRARVDHEGVTSTGLGRRAESLLDRLPRGRTLPLDVWRQRHAGIMVLLWLHVPALFAMAVIRGNSVLHSLVEAGGIAAIAVWALAVDQRKALSTVLASVGLMACSAELVHLSGGLIEMHFHFFVMVGVVTLYQDWRPFLIAIGSVVVHHTVVGVMDPEAVYNHPAAVASPWKWALIHAAFIVAMSATGMVSWKLNELLLEAGILRERNLAEAQAIARLGSWEHDVATGETTWSDAMRELLGAESSTRPTLRDMYRSVHPDDRALLWADMERVRAGGVQHDLDCRLVDPSGSVRWVHSRAEATWESGKIVGMSGTIQDITDRREVEDQLRARESELREAMSLLNATLESTADGILVVDLEGRISSFNGKFAEMWRLPADVLATGDDDAALTHVLGQLVDPDGFLDKVRELYAQPGADSEDTLTFLDGRVVERFSMPQRVGGEVVGRVWSFHDVTQRTKLEQELAHQAFHDSLTGLANQFLFRDRLDHALARRQETLGVTVAVLFLDLDDFKDVNDSLGHPAGDELLRVVGQRVQRCLRGGDTAARLGGDEFAVILEDLRDEAEADRTAVRLLETIARPIRLAEGEVRVSASLGVATPEHDADADAAELLRRADLAMYAAKRGGKNRFERFAPAMREQLIERLEVVNDLRGASLRDEFVLHYQPVVSLGSGELHGVEALIRWRHPQRGLLLPDAFVAYAEEGGLIDEIGRWVLEDACSQASRWHRDHPSRSEVGLAINLSPNQLRAANIVDVVADVLERTGLRPELLTLEITEGVMMEDTQRSLARLTELKALGVCLAVDDFGTGYSSLSYLHQFPIDILKIDRAFVDGIGQGAENSALAHAIVRLARSLQLRAVAEGVEHLEQLRWLQSVGCDFAQGYYLGRPTDAEGVEALLASRDPFPIVTTSAVGAKGLEPLASAV